MSAESKALVVEDDEGFAKSVMLHIEHLGYVSDWASDGKRGLEMALANEYSFVLLDYKLPQLEGVDVCRGIRALKPDLPIVVLSTEADQVSKVLLLELGADDYITKPFCAAELKARLRAVLRRSRRLQVEPEVVSYKELTIDLATHQASLGDTTLDLTAFEFSILSLLASNPGRVFSRAQILESLYGEEIQGYEKSINVHISRLRNKLESNPKKPQYIFTQRGAGYKFGT